MAFRNWKEGYFCKMDGWLPFQVLFTVFLSYLDDGRVIMKGCVQWKEHFDV